MHFLPRLAIVVAVVALGAQCSHAGIVSTEAVLLGPAENPPNASPGTGFATVEMDTIAHTLHVVVSFSNLLGTTTSAHIHARVAPPGNAAVATTTPTFVGFPIGVTSGSLDQIYNTTLASTFSAGFITSSGGTVAGAEAALFDALVAREATLISTPTYSPVERFAASCSRRLFPSLPACSSSERGRWLSSSVDESSARRHGRPNRPARSRRSRSSSLVAPHGMKSRPTPRSDSIRSRKSSNEIAAALA